MTNFSQEDIDGSSGGADKVLVEDILRLRQPASKLARLNPRAVLFTVCGVTLAITLVVVTGLVMSSGSSNRSKRTTQLPGRPNESVVSEKLPIGSWGDDYSYLREHLESKAEQSSEAAEKLPPTVSAVTSTESPHNDSRQAERFEEMLERLRNGLDSPIVFARTPVQIRTLDRSVNPEAATSHAASQERLALTQHNTSDIVFLRYTTPLSHRVSGRLHPPTSKYDVRAGSVLPAALISAIHSDLPGDIISQITEDVYDTETAEHMLVPAGSKLLGTYRSEVAPGQDRVLVVWQRLILPNGKSIDLDAMPGVDMAGAAGLHDEVDYHIKGVVGATALSSAIALAGNLARSETQSGTALSAVGETVAQEGARFGQQIVDRQLRRQPTITVRSGWEFNVLVNKDIPLEVYQPVRSVR